jgi:RHS repeat-associated protein
VTATTGESNPFQYAGRENDGTGLYFNRRRYYVPEWGRFLSEDPLGFAGGLNRYTYAGNDPINWLDPSGLDPVPGNQLPIGPDGIVYQPDRRGLAPRDKDGNEIELHHRDQNPDGPIDEMTDEEHNKQDHSRRPGVDHGSKWRTWRERYWRQQWDNGRFRGLPVWRGPGPSPQLKLPLFAVRDPAWQPIPGVPWWIFLLPSGGGGGGGGEFGSTRPWVLTPGF